MALADISGDEASRQAIKIQEETGNKALGVECNVADKLSVEVAVKKTTDAFGVNVTGSFFACKYTIPLMRQAKRGSIILTASQMGQVAWPGSTAYCTTKGAILQLVKGIALDHKDENIRCNSISPGGVATDRLLARWGDMETAEKEWGPKHALGRLGQPTEIASGAVFLASDESSFMTGADLLLDGGYTAW